MLAKDSSLGAGTASFALEATETPWKVNKKSVLQPRLFGGNDELGGKSGGSYAVTASERMYHG